MPFKSVARSGLNLKIGAGALLAALTLLVASQVGQAAGKSISCDAPSLIAAIEAANSTPEADELQLTKGCTYTLTARNNSYFGFNGLPTITSPVTIIGNGSTIQRDPNAPSFRIVTVDTTGSLRLVGVTLTNGLAKGGNGGTDRGNSDDGGGGGGGAGLGGAIYNRGALTVSVSSLVNNTAQGGDGGASSNNTGEDSGGGGGGGGLGGNGGNTGEANGGDAGGGGGGAGENDEESIPTFGGAGGFGGGSAAAVKDSNSAGGGGAGIGGAIFNEGGTVTLVNAVVGPNVVNGGKGGEGETPALNGQAGQGIEPGVFNYGSGQVVAQSGKCKGKTATIVGTPGADKVVGTSGADVFVGGAGNDKFSGGKGNDLAYGGKGKDKLFGQAARTRCSAKQAATCSTAAPARTC
jgi:hypothetical protein